MSVELVLIAFWVTYIALSAVYSGNLTATLAVRKVKLPFTTIEGLAQDQEYILVVLANSFQEQLYRV